MSQHSNEELEKYRRVFALFDKENSGAIGKDELREAMQALGTRPSEAELEKLFNEVDKDGNGEIDFTKFCIMIKQISIKKESDEEIIRMCFVVFDQDQSGVISESEFRYTLKEFGDFEDGQIGEIFKEVDINGNGQLEYDEFAQMVRTYLLDAPTITVNAETAERRDSTISTIASRFPCFYR